MYKVLYIIFCYCFYIRFCTQLLRLIQDIFMRTYASSRVKRRSFYRRSKLQMFWLIFGGQYGVSIQSSTKVRETFRKITQKLWATKTWDLDKLFKNQSLIRFHFLGFFYWTVSNLFFVAWQWKRSICTAHSTRVEPSRQNCLRVLINFI